jgi:hypothetical protein
MNSLPQPKDVPVVKGGCVAMVAYVVYVTEKQARLIDPSCSIMKCGDEDCKTRTHIMHLKYVRSIQSPVVIKAKNDNYRGQIALTSDQIDDCLAKIKQ